MLDYECPEHNEMGYLSRDVSAGHGFCLTIHSHEGFLIRMIRRVSLRPYFRITSWAGIIALLVLAPIMFQASCSLVLIGWKTGKLIFLRHDRLGFGGASSSSDILAMVLQFTSLYAHIVSGAVAMASCSLRNFPMRLASRPSSQLAPMGFPCFLTHVMK